MSTGSPRHEQGHLDSVCLYALQALPADEVPGVEAQIAACAACRNDFEALGPVVDALAAWPTDLLRPSPSVWERLSLRLAAETGQAVLPTPPRRPEPAWEQAAPGITCKLLATDAERGRVSMLVRLAPGAEYPPHTHAGVEELHMLEGELMVDAKRLRAGEYLRSEPGTTDRRVWSPTGCMGVLLTSTRDQLL